jgi:hypothetical protein
LLWLGLYALWGAYRDVYRKSRLKEMGHTLVTSLLGVTVLFFALILDDEILDHTTYYESLAVLFGLHFGITFLFRFILYTITARRVQRGDISFPTLMVGSDAKAVELMEEFGDGAVGHFVSDLGEGYEEAPIPIAGDQGVGAVGPPPLLPEDLEEPGVRSASKDSVGHLQSEALGMVGWEVRILSCMLAACFWSPMPRGLGSCLLRLCFLVPSAATFCLLAAFQGERVCVDARGQMVSKA